MKLILKIFLAVFCILAGSGIARAKTVTEKMADAMNSSAWFELDSLYRMTPKDSIPEFFEVFSRCLIGNRLNRQDVSVPAFGELLSTQSQNLGLSNLLNSVAMFAVDLSRTGENGEASSVIRSVLEATGPHLDSATVKSMERLAGKYAAFADYDIYGVSFSESEPAEIPFRIVPVGPEDKNSVLMHLDDSYINGISADITFDTGAGVNIISDSLANAYGLIRLDAGEMVQGIGLQSGGYAIARELKLGNITLTDVPFCTIDLTSHNSEADKYFDAFNIIVGSEVMLKLKDLTIDFRTRKIEVPKEAPERTDAWPNMCFSSEFGLLAKGRILGDGMMMCIDSGDASYGTLGTKFLECNRDYIETHSTADSLRTAGIGGVFITQCYRMKGMPLVLGGTTVTVPGMVVRTADSDRAGEYECCLGLKSLMLFDRVRFNLADMILSTECMDNHNAAEAFPDRLPKFDYTPAKGAAWWQTMGHVVLEATREYLTTH